jgi:hypothetical protein
MTRAAVARAPTAVVDTVPAIGLTVRVTILLPRFCLPVLRAIRWPVLAAIRLPVFLPIERRVAAALAEGDLAERSRHQAGNYIGENLAHCWVSFLALHDAESA